MSSPFPIDMAIIIAIVFLGGIAVGVASLILLLRFRTRPAEVRKSIYGDQPPSDSEPAATPQARPAVTEGPTAVPDPREEFFPRTFHGPDDPVYGELRAALDALVAQYKDSDLPAPIVELKKLIEARAYPEIKERLPILWKDIIDHHRAHGIRIRKPITDAINRIVKLMKGV